MIARLFTAVIVVVAILSVIRGGRYERSAMFMFITAWIGTLASQRVFHDYAPAPMFTTIDAALLIGLGWIFWRYRRIWVAGALIIQMVLVAIDILNAVDPDLGSRRYLMLMSILSYTQLGFLSFGVLRRWFGPPVRPPAQVDHNAVR